MYCMEKNILIDSKILKKLILASYFFEKSFKKNSNNLLPTNHYYVLSLLYNRSLSPKEISNILDIPKQQTNKILENLEKQNYIIRQKGVASDARITQISISENGKSLLLNTLDAFSQYLNSYLIALSPSEQTILKKFFDHIDKKIIF